jgi:hypothetical protein
MGRSRSNSLGLQILLLAVLGSSDRGFVSLSRVPAVASGNISRLELKVEQVVEALLLAAVVEHGANFKLISLKKEENITNLDLTCKHKT